MSTEQKIADLKAQHEAELGVLITKLKHEEELRALCPEGYEPKSFSYLKYSDVDVLYFDVANAYELRKLVVAWHSLYRTFLPIGEYTKGATVVSAYPWDEYATVEPKQLCDDGIEVRNHVGRGFNSLDFEFFPVIHGRRICVHANEAFRANIFGFHGHVSANYDSWGDPIYNSIHKTPPAAWNAAAFTVRYGSGSDDAANFCAVFSFEQLMDALPQP